jgi:drug/metabolite transporter (DMT)-like permease
MRTAAPALTPAPAAELRLPLPLMVAAFCLLWSSAFAVAKVAIADSPPLLMLTARFLLAGLLTLGLAALSGASLRLDRRDVVVFALLGVANQAVYLGLGYVGMKTISAGLAALIISANPVLTAVLASTWLGEQVTWRRIAGLVLGIGGVALVVENRLALGSDHLAGILFSLAALVSLVLGTILFKRFTPRGGLWVGNGVQSVAAGVALAPFALATESVADVVPTWRLLAAFAYLVLLVSVFAYVLWFRILAVSGATAASAYHFLMPPLGMLFGWLLLGEHVAAVDLIGIVPVALGIYLVTRPARTVPADAG